MFARHVQVRQSLQAARRMGRRGGGGGTAGGGRSGGRNDVRYTGVVAPFLERMGGTPRERPAGGVATERDANREEGGRQTSQTDSRPGKLGDRSVRQRQQTEPTVTPGDVQTLQALGFAVLPTGTDPRDGATVRERRGKPKVGTAPEGGRGRGAGSGGGENRFVSRSLSSISKKRKVSTASQRNLRNRLSFVGEGNDESSSDETVG